MEVELTALQRRGYVGVGLAQSTVVQGALEHLVHEGRQPVIRRGAKDSVTDNGIALTPKSHRHSQPPSQDSRRLVHELFSHAQF